MAFISFLKIYFPLFLLLLGFDRGGWYFIRSPVLNTSPSTPILNPLQKWLWQNLWTRAFYSPYHFLGGIQNCKCDHNTCMHAYTDSNTHVSTFTCTFRHAHLHTGTHMHTTSGGRMDSRGLVDPSSAPAWTLRQFSSVPVCQWVRTGASVWAEQTSVTQVLAAIGCNMHSSIVA